MTLDPAVIAALDAAAEFAGWVRGRNEAGVDGWLDRAEMIPTLRAGAMGLRRDEAEVQAGLTVA